MDAFKHLRDKAAQKRDRAITRAKREHEITIQKIAELENRLSTRPTRKRARSEHVKLIDLIYSLLPHDRPFSVNDVLGFVIDADPERQPSKATINTNLNRILKAGSIKRVQFAKAGNPALFAMPDLDVECEKTMLEWAQGVDGYTDLEPVELMVKMVEAGYEMEVDPQRAVASLERELTSKPPENRNRACKQA